MRLNKFNEMRTLFVTHLFTSLPQHLMGVVPVEAVLQRGSTWTRRVPDYEGVLRRSA
jgi:hypothetical protein